MISACRNVLEPGFLFLISFLLVLLQTVQFQPLAGLTAVAAVLPGGLSKTTTLTGRVGQNITLNTGVSGLPNDSHILWNRGSEKNVILNSDKGKLVRLISTRFHLDRDSGSLTIESLNKNDTQHYQGQIINNNGSFHDFNLTVVEAPWDPHRTSVGSILIAVVASIGFVVICIVCAAKHNKLKGNCRRRGTLV